jgi:DNA-3-methyladenine glycosylase
MPLAPLPRTFYDRQCLKVAEELLGRVLVRRIGDRTLRGAIVEVEAYAGRNDLGSHASRGKTNRTSIMFGPPGFAYIYLIYGMYHCLNVVADHEGEPAAVLIRALQPFEGLDEATDGPGKLCRALQIDRSLLGIDMTSEGPLFVSDELALPDFQVATGPRVGIDYAGEWALKPWRLWVERNPYVSRPNRRSAAIPRKDS